MRLFEHTENGVIVCQSKLDYIKQELKDFLDGISVEKQTNEMRKKPLQIEWNTRIYNMVELVLRKAETPMPNNEALQLTKDDFNQLYDEYCELVCYIESTVGISYHKEKAEFCRYCAITPQAFEEIKANGDIYQRETLISIDDNIGANLLVTAGNGAIKAKPTELQLTSKSSFGHRMQTTGAKEVAVVVPITENSFTPLAELQPPVMPKRLKGKSEED